MLNYYVLDVETSGLDVKVHELTQLSVIRVKDRMQLSKYIKADHPERASPKALEITKRTYQDLLKGIAKEEAVEKFHNFFLQDDSDPENRCVVGHQISFDRRFCFSLWQQFEKIFPASLFLDTKDLTRQYAKFSLGIAKPKLTLRASLELLGGTFSGQAHSAIYDTQATYKLYDRLMKKNCEFLPHIKRIPHE